MSKCIGYKLTSFVHRYQSGTVACIECPQISDVHRCTRGVFSGGHLIGVNNRGTGVFFHWRIRMSSIVKKPSECELQKRVLGMFSIDWMIRLLHLLLWIIIEFPIYFIEVRRVHSVFYFGFPRWLRFTQSFEINIFEVWMPFDFRGTIPTEPFVWTTTQVDDEVLCCLG